MTADLSALFDSQRQTALDWRRSDADQRRERLRRLRDAILAHRADFHAALAEDFAKPAAEVDLTELMPVIDEAGRAIAHLRRWMRPRSVRPTLAVLGARARVNPVPRGRCLIIAPWNYPLSLSVGPLISALAAGNTAIVKPSELTPATSALLARVIGNTFPPDQVAVVEGDADTARALLALPFDHVFFTGSPAVGRQVAAACAQGPISVTLELGGKSPAIVTPSADIAAAAATLLWGKLINGGQTCVAPDFVLVHQSVRDAFVAEASRVLRDRFGATAAQRRASPDLARMVSPRHAARLAELVADAVARGARVVEGGDSDVAARYVAPTLILDPSPDARLLDEEIFGPVLPILAYDDIAATIAGLNRQPTPLAAYVWGADRRDTDPVVQGIAAGGLCVNHCVVHFAHGRLPFGGLGPSGLGAAHGEHGFRTFSHLRAELTGSRLMATHLVAPPYTVGRRRLVAALLGLVRRLG